MVQFVENNAEEIIKETIQQYEQMTGKTLYPAQVERIFIDLLAYRESVIRGKVNDTANSLLLRFSREPILDYIGEIVGVRRLLATPAVCTMKLTFNQSGSGIVTIPAGTRFSTSDGLFVFATDYETSVLVSAQPIVHVPSTCLTVGRSGNGYAPNSVTMVLDPLPYLMTATNLDTTSGGADRESDEALKERIRLAPQSFSNAGSTGAYKFHARSANPGIIDVSVTSPNPGQVNLYPLMTDGTLPNTQVLNQVYAACNDERVRPLTDTVLVLAPVVISYDIELELILLNSAVPSEVESLVINSIQEYTNEKKHRLGLDIVKSEIVKIAKEVQGVYDVNVVQPSGNVIVQPEEVAICNNVNVSIVGFSDE